MMLSIDNDHGTTPTYNIKNQLVVKDNMKKKTPKLLGNTALNTPQGDIRAKGPLLEITPASFIGATSRRHQNLTKISRHATYGRRESPHLSFTAPEQQSKGGQGRLTWRR